MRKLGYTVMVAFVFYALCQRNAGAQQDKQDAPRPTTAQLQRQTPSGVGSVEYLTGERPRPLPFSDAVRVGSLLYLSGQLGTDDNLALVPGGVQAETKQVMARIRRILERHGSSLDHVVKCTVMLADMSEWQAMNEVYVTYFSKDRLPARSAFGVSGLALGGRVEIECMAVVK
jgi:2-iminobutanoate/2-iminopropanoate deaminase